MFRWVKHTVFFIFTTLIARKKIIKKLDLTWYCILVQNNNEIFEAIHFFSYNPNELFSFGNFYTIVILCFSFQDEKRFAFTLLLCNAILCVKM